MNRREFVQIGASLVMLPVSPQTEADRLKRQFVKSFENASGKYNVESIKLISLNIWPDQTLPDILMGWVGLMSVTANGKPLPFLLGSAVCTRKELWDGPSTKDFTSELSRAVYSRFGSERIEI